MAMGGKEGKKSKYKKARIRVNLIEESEFA